jgi:hypothetical protein
MYAAPMMARPAYDVRLDLPRVSIMLRQKCDDPGRDPERPFANKAIFDP